MWLVRTESARKNSYLTINSKHEAFPTEERARKYIAKTIKKDPDVKCRLFQEVSAIYKQESLLDDDNDYSDPATDKYYM